MSNLQKTKYIIGKRWKNEIVDIAVSRL